MFFFFVYVCRKVGGQIAVSRPLLFYPVSTGPACRPLAFSIVLTDGGPGTGLGTRSSPARLSFVLESHCVPCVPP